LICQQQQINPLAQDLLFAGIAEINRQAIKHVDVSG
jgi:hypothetical protein